MYPSIYESHSHKDPNFPIIFHCDTLDAKCDYFVMHYHENIELLYFIEGTGIVTYGVEQIEVKQGDVIAVNANVLHAIKSAPSCRHYCLIIDKLFYESFDTELNNLTIQSVIKDDKVKAIFEQITEEIGEESAYNKLMVKGLVIQLLTYLRYNHSMSSDDLPSATNTKKLKIVKEAISYMRRHFQEELSVDVICKEVGFSKYYFCRVFKEITGKTIVDYINFLRCDHARKLLTSGDYNVTESAEESGFKNLSYFSKIYKKYMGNLPSIENKKEA